MSFGAIMIFILWRFRPALWLDGVIARLIGWALALLEDEDHREWLKETPANCAWFGGWLALGETRLNELIHYRACELLNLACQGRKLPGFSPARSVRTLDQAIQRFCRLAERYCDIERLARLRAHKLKSLLTSAVIELEPVPHPLAAASSSSSAALSAVSAIVKTSSAPAHPAQPIRAPPHRRTPDNQACPTPPNPSARTRSHA